MAAVEQGDGLVGAHDHGPDVLMLVGEAVDAAVGRVAEATLAMGGALFITADHGNCECMRDEAGNPHTAHTLNMVPAVLVASGFEARQLHAGGALSDVAPTLLKLFGLAQPEVMDGKSLF